MSDIESLPDPEDFYEYLGVAATATEAEIKKAYYSLAVKCHPDRATPETRTESTRRFQLLSRVYSVLSDPKKREIYDTTGSVDSLSSFLSMDVDWVEFWRDVFPKVTVESVAEFAGQFRGSDEERREVFDAYIQHRGDIVKIMESVTLASMLDEDRFRAMIDAGIAANELPRFAAAEASPFSAASPLRSPAARLRRGGAPASPSPIRSPGRRDVLVGSPSDSPLSSPVRASRSRRRTLLVAEEESDGDASLAEDPGPDGMAAEELEDAEPSGTLTPDLETARKRRRFAAAREAREAEQALKEIMAKRRQECQQR
ncbi:hypothetical protein H696_01919 [Fonticula alba]|uniref:J domain-containing protein n=1 Tax=Fonticula alba TaxID=691883 RepID=A0A058ZC18_FONAL|nr:hypothetical protein H696_01919 [Fonticula alba]KCV70972.1 hypothetical protein H696_01919 [Fonticula alba]|eukprot:XP_009494095.1 hypothetical protein H696_01919 [Fonticula alba]